MPRSRRAAASLDRQAVSREAAFRRAALQLFGTEREEIVAFLATRAAQGDAVLLAAMRFINEQYTDANGAYHQAWVERYAELIASTTRVGAGDLAAATGFDFNLVNPEVISAAVERAARLADFVGASSADRISEVIADAIASGDISDMSDRIRNEAFDEDITMARAERIARTETVGAMNEGEYTMALASDVFAEKEWMTQGDERVRESHADLDGVRIGIDEVFDNGLLFPGDQSTGDASEVVNCRCTLLYYDSPSDTTGDGGEDDGEE